MAGYLFNLKAKNASAAQEAVKNIFISGTYSTRMSAPANGKWKAHHEATFGDYATMRPGDSVYFFSKRKIFGIGELVSPNKSGGFCNYPNSCEASTPGSGSIAEASLVNFPGTPNAYRWICFFKPSPWFFEAGVDMDDFLSASPQSFKMLRTFWKRSFIKLDDEENSAFKEIILRFNRDSFKSSGKSGVFKTEWKKTFIDASKKISRSKAYELDANAFVKSALHKKGLKLNHEMAIEADILFRLGHKELEVQKVFGKFDYLHHQVVASPFKPIDYMDKMDIFGYSYLSQRQRVKDRYVVIEIKKGTGKKEDVDQLMRYVDWIRAEYAWGDYSLIEAFLVAHDFEEEVKSCIEENAHRYFSIGHRPIQNKKWSNLKAISYSYSDLEKKIKYKLIN